VPGLHAGRPQHLPDKTVIAPRLQTDSPAEAGLLWSTHTLINGAIMAVLEDPPATK
jgi:hypothetical protein